MTRVRSKHRFRTKQQGCKEEIPMVIRGRSGDFLFGIPLSYTMEVWWIDSHGMDRWGVLI